MGRVQKHLSQQLEEKAVTGGRNTGLQQNTNSSDNNNWAFRDSEGNVVCRNILTVNFNFARCSWAEKKELAV